MLKKVSVALIVLSGICALAFSTVRENETMAKNTHERYTTPIAIGVYDPIVVLELFTSQGCSSCPSADLLLEKTKKQFEKEVYALSYHVDYWNYIGWEDPFSKSDYSKKQRKYNIKFRNRSNYTPQVVVNGKEHFVGSSMSKMTSAINTYKREKSENHLVTNELQIVDGKLNFKYDIKGPIKAKNIRALIVLNERTTSVKRGENRNRTLKNSNVVVAEKTAHLDLKNGSMTITIPEIVDPTEEISLIVLVESDDYDITAAHKRKIDRT